MEKRFVYIRSNEKTVVKVSYEVFYKNGFRISCKVQANGRDDIYVTCNLSASKINDIIDFYTEFAMKPFPMISEKINNRVEYEHVIKTSSIEQLYPEWFVNFLKRIRTNSKYDGDKWLYFYDKNKPKNDNNGFFCFCNEPHFGLPSFQTSEEISRLMNFMHDSDELFGTTLDLKEMISTQVHILIHD